MTAVRVKARMGSEHGDERPMHRQKRGGVGVRGTGRVDEMTGCHFCRWYCDFYTSTGDSTMARASTTLLSRPVQLAVPPAVLLSLGLLVSPRCPLQSLLPSVLSHTLTPQRLTLVATSQTSKLVRKSCPIDFQITCDWLRMWLQ